MLKKIMALAATTAMLGANAAAHAINTARAAIKSATGSGPVAAGDEAKDRAGDGRNILPSIPRPPPLAEPQRVAPRHVARKTGNAGKGAAHKASKARVKGTAASRKKKKSTR